MPLILEIIGLGVVVYLIAYGIERRIERNAKLQALEDASAEDNQISARRTAEAYFGAPGGTGNSSPTQRPPQRARPEAKPPTTSRITTKGKSK